MRIVDVWDAVVILTTANCVTNVANAYLGDAMTINDKPIYLIRYPWDMNSEVSVEDIAHAVKHLTQQIHLLDPKADCLAMPNDLSLEKMNIDDLEDLIQVLSDYVLDLKTNYRDEEEE